ncbi:integrase [Streptomyces sp. NPDC006703]
MSHPLVESGQYTSAAFAQVCDDYGIRRSLGRVGSSYDNALAEGF